MATEHKKGPAFRSQLTRRVFAITSLSETLFSLDGEARLRPHPHVMLTTQLGTAGICLSLFGMLTNEQSRRLELGNKACHVSIGTVF
jgi:hypothetical protein